MVSVVDQAKRALVVLIRSLALAYKFPIDVKRDSPEQDVSTAYRRLSRKVHPDHGGKTDKLQRT